MPQCELKSGSRLKSGGLRRSCRSYAVRPGVPISNRTVPRLLYRDAIFQSAIPCPFEMLPLHVVNEACVFYQICNGAAVAYSMDLPRPFRPSLIMLCTPSFYAIPNTAISFSRAAPRPFVSIQPLQPSSREHPSNL